MARMQTTARPYYDPAHEEWSLRTGPNTWLVWQHGTRAGDEERLASAGEAELKREQAMATERNRRGI